MSEDQGEKQPPKANDFSFGSGLGSDFKPLGKRVMIGPARNHQKLVVRSGSHEAPKTTTRESSTD